MEAFDKALTELVDSGKLSSSRIKGVTDLAMQNVKNDAHLASSLFRTHKRAKPANKLWALYVLDAIARECRSQVRRTAKSQDAGNNSPGPAADGTPGGFLAKVETFLERMIDESWERGLPDHKEKVKKLVSIWVQATTFASAVLVRCNARMQDNATASTTPPHSPPRSTPIASTSQPAPAAGSNAPSLAAMPLSAQTALAALLANAAGSSAPSAPVAPTAQDPSNPLNALLQQLASQTNANVGSGSGTPPPVAPPFQSSRRREDSPPYQRRSASPPGRGAGREPAPSSGPGSGSGAGAFNVLDANAWRDVGNQANMFGAAPSLDAIHAWAMRGGLARFGIPREAIVAAGQGHAAPSVAPAHPLGLGNPGFAGGASMMGGGPGQGQTGGGGGGGSDIPGMKRSGRMVQTADGRWVFSKGA